MRRAMITKQTLGFFHIVNRVEIGKVEKGLNGAIRIMGILIFHDAGDIISAPLFGKQGFLSFKQLVYGSP